MKPQIVIVAPLLPPVYSGAGKRAFRHSCELQKMGILSLLITRTKTDKINDGHLANKIKKVRHSEIISPKSLIKIYNLLSFNIASFWLLQKYRRKFQIIHYFGDWWNSLGSLMFKSIFNKKIIVEFTLLPEKTEKNKSWTLKHIRRLVLDRADIIVTISLALQNWCTDHKINTRTILIPNDTDISKDCSPERANQLKKDIGINEHYPVILFVGPKVYRKGFDIVLKVFEMVKKEYPWSLLILVGPRGENIFDDSNGIRKDIIDIGLVNDVEYYYRISDITLFPSRREGFGSVIIESMAAGTPVIARKLQGITDTIIEDNIDGFLVNSDEPYDYLRRIKQIINGKDAKEISNRARNKIDKKYSTFKVFQKYFKLYQSMLES